MSYVYVITDDFAFKNKGVLQEIEHVKIGFTSDSNVRNRVKQLQTGNPRPLTLICYYEFQDSEMARQMERLAHWNLKSSMANGEWFYCTEDVRNFLASLRKISNFHEGDEIAEIGDSPIREVANG